MYSCVVYCLLVYDTFVFFFKQKTAYELRISDWSSDVCSSDLPRPCGLDAHGRAAGARRRSVSPKRRGGRRTRSFLVREERRHAGGRKSASAVAASRASSSFLLANARLSRGCLDGGLQRDRRHDAVSSYRRVGVRPDQFECCRT